MISIKDLLRKLNILNPGYYEGDKYIIEVDSDNEWGNLYYKLNKGVEENIITTVERNNVISPDESKLIYYFGSYKIQLKANFVDETYILEVGRKPVND